MHHPHPPIPILASAALAVLLALRGAVAQEPVVPTGYIFSQERTLSLSLAESMAPVQSVVLNLKFDDTGRLTGKLILDANPVVYSEFGDEIGRDAGHEETSLDCSLSLHKDDKGNRLYSLRGPKISSRLSLAIVPEGFPQVRLLVHAKDGTVRRVVGMFQPMPEPCHPGCFPKGSQVLTGEKTRGIETLRVGDKVTTLLEDGTTSVAVIEQVFATRNKLIELRTRSGKLISTPSQPLALKAGEFRPAGEVKAGDMLLRWSAGKPTPDEVIDVAPAADDSAVFNLVLGEPTAIVVGGFVVRSKPAQQATPAP